MEKIFSSQEKIPKSVVEPPTHPTIPSMIFFLTTLDIDGKILTEKWEKIYDNFITICDIFFVTFCDDIQYILRQLFYYILRRVYYILRQLLHFATGLLHFATVITFCDDYYTGFLLLLTSHFPAFCLKQVSFPAFSQEKVYNFPAFLTKNSIFSSSNESMVSAWFLQGPETSPFKFPGAISLTP